MELLFLDGTASISKAFAGGELVANQLTPRSIIRRLLRGDTRAGGQRRHRMTDRRLTSVSQPFESSQV